MTTALTAVLVPHPDVHVVALDDEKILFVPGGDTLHRLDAVAALVWDCLLPPAPLAEIVADLAAAFGGESARIAADVLTLTDELRTAGALVEAGDVEDVRLDA
jgi:hypothetical protein